MSTTISPAASMTPTHAIQTLPTLLARLEGHADAVRHATETAAAHWQGLRHAGGAREDHAAALLSADLAPALRDLAAFVGRVIDQLDRMKADPFRE